MNEINPLRRQPTRATTKYDEPDAEASRIVGTKRSAVQEAEAALWGQTEINGSQAMFAGGPAYIAPKDRPRKAPRITVGWAEPLRKAVPSWRIALGSPALDKAVKTLLAKIDVAEQAAASFKSLSADEKAETAAVIEAAKVGLPKAVERTDWEVEAAVREQQWTDAYADAHKAASHCRAVTSSETRKRLPQLVAYAAQKRSAALKQAKAAQDDITLAIAATTAIREADLALKLSPRGWWRQTPERSGAPHKASQGLRDVLAYLQTDDRIVSGAYILDQSPEVPAETREFLASRPSGSREEYALFQIEASEDWKITDYTQGLRSVHPIDPEWKSAWIDKRELPR